MDCPYIPDEGLVPPTPVHVCPYLVGLRCSANGGHCLVDVAGVIGSSQHCLRYQWLRKVQNKVVTIAKLQTELNTMVQGGLL